MAGWAGREGVWRWEGCGGGELVGIGAAGRERNEWDRRVAVVVLNNGNRGRARLEIWGADGGFWNFTCRACTIC